MAGPGVGNMNRSLTITILGKLDPNLSPNARVHWRTLADAKADAKAIASLVTRQELGYWSKDLNGVERAVYDIERGIPKGGKQMDADNLTASCKATLDGIAATLGVDDRGWSLGTVTQVRDPDEIGYVRITFRWQQVKESAA